MKKWVKYSLISLGVIILAVIVFIGYLWMWLQDVKKIEKAYEERREYMLKNPPVYNKNEKGEYRMVVRLGESPELLDQRNPNLFTSEGVVADLGSNRPVLPFAEIPKIHLELLDENYERVFDLVGFKDIVIYGGAEWMGVSDMSIDLFRIQTCEFWEKPCTPEMVSKMRYEQYWQIVGMLKKYGWKPYVPMVGYKDEPYGYARVFGEESWKTDLQWYLDLERSRNDSNFEPIYPPYYVYPDGYYVDTYDKWQKYAFDRDLLIFFYKNNLLLQLNIGNATTTIDIKTNADSFFYRYDEHTRAEKWKEYLAADIPKWQAKRKEAEDILRAKGYTIDESYVDAPLPKEFLEWQQAKQSNSK